MGGILENHRDRVRDSSDKRKTWGGPGGGLLSAEPVVHDILEGIH